MVAQAFARPALDRCWVPRNCLARQREYNRAFSFLPLSFGLLAHVLFITLLPVAAARVAWGCGG